MDSELSKEKGGDTGHSGITRRQFVAGAAAAGGLLALGPLGAAVWWIGRPVLHLHPGPRSRRAREATCGWASSAATRRLCRRPRREPEEVDCMRLTALYDALAIIDPTNNQVVLHLAEEMTPSADALSWTVRLKPGVTFHNGKPLTADDVIYTFKRIMDPKNPKTGASVLSLLDPHGMKALDSRTVQLKMLKPYALFMTNQADFWNRGIVPVGYDPKNPVGTGPFKYNSFTPGQQSVFDRNENYFQGAPHVDQLTIIDYASNSAAQNSLLGGTIDVYADASTTIAKQLANSSSIKEVTSAAAMCTDLNMRVDQAPFSDVRVRQAFRLLCDRPQFVSAANDGYGVPGKGDFLGEQDPDTDTQPRSCPRCGAGKSSSEAGGPGELELVSSSHRTSVLERSRRLRSLRSRQRPSASRSRSTTCRSAPCLGRTSSSGRSPRISGDTAHTSATPLRPTFRVPPSMRPTSQTSATWLCMTKPTRRLTLHAYANSFTRCRRSTSTKVATSFRAGVSRSMSCLHV